MARARAGRPVAGARRNAIPPLRMSVKGLRWIVDPLGGRNANHGRVNASSGRSLRHNKGSCAALRVFGAGEQQGQSGWGMAFRQNRDGLAMTSPSFPQGFPSPKTAPSVIGFPKKQKFRQAGQSPSRATFEKKKTIKTAKAAPAVGSNVRESAVADPNRGGGFRAARQAVGAAGLAEAKSRRNASVGRRAKSGPRAAIEPGGGAPRGPIPEPLR